MQTKVLEYIENRVDRFPDPTFGEGARCSVYLKDGTYLPCVLLRDWQKAVSLFMARLDQEGSGRAVLAEIKDIAEQSLVRFFITNQNIVKLSDIASIEVSPYAIPHSFLRELDLNSDNKLLPKNTLSFVLEMNDDQLFLYENRALNQEFYDLPSGYSFSDVKKVHKSAYKHPDGLVRRVPITYKDEQIKFMPEESFTQKPFFVCYTEGF